MFFGINANQQVLSSNANESFSVRSLVCFRDFTKENASDLLADPRPGIIFSAMNSWGNSFSLSAAKNWLRLVALALKTLDWCVWI